MWNGKVLDTVPLTGYCKGCKLAENFRVSDPAKYDQWKAEHNCPTNHGGSVRVMEAIGAKTMFQRSIEKNRLRYTEYLGTEVKEMCYRGETRMRRSRPETGWKSVACFET